ncbi:MAG TPA: cell division protein ZapB [Burkholderiaceae bacterium]|nr:cell division protein ZapB [Burkholderiaceae bacterium]
MSDIDRLVERVERLLLRYEELQRTNALLEQQLAGVVAERDSLRSRLSAARARIDALIDRLPEAPGTAPAEAGAPEPGPKTRAEEGGRA